MGTIKGKFIKGLVGTAIFREYRGKQVVQGTPQILESNRTVGTKNAATVFGKASQLASGIRRGLTQICGKYYDGTMIYRLNAEVLRCLNAVKDSETQQFKYGTDSFRSLAGFEFHAGSMVKDYLHLQPQVTVEGAKLQVTIPDIQIPAALKWPPAYLKSCKLAMVVTLIDLGNGSVNRGAIKVMDIPYTHHPKVVTGQTFEFDLIPGCLCITGISPQYIENTFVGESNVNSKSFNPAAILDARLLEGSTDPAETKNFYVFNK